MKNIKVLLLYPPEQTWPDTMCKPNGSLAYPMLAGALIREGVEVEIYDACVGNSADNLDEVFYNPTPLPTGMVRTGVSEDRILEKVSSYDIIGITSIFSHQETMVLKTAKIIKEKFPDKLLVSGGVNARHRMDLFFNNGFDLICTSEAEDTIVKICRKVQKGEKDFSDIPFLACRKESKVFVNKSGQIFWNLDDLPMPAWHLLPNERYWKIGRPHGGHFSEEEDLRYASMMTSMGCPFSCSFCHIAGENEDSNSGPIKKFRIKSDERVIREMEVLKSLGVKQIFIEDDSIFGKKKRAIRLLNKIDSFGFDILDVNGVNIVHLLKNGEPDPEVIDALVSAGFRDIVLPFESSSPRIIKKYASNKWNIQRSNVSDLIKECKKAGLRVAGNFMIGYPDESREEIMSTIAYAKDRMSDGLDASNFFLVMPLPGTPLFDHAVKNGHLPKKYNPDRMHWQKANMKNTKVPPEELEAIRDSAWEDINRPDFRNYKKTMIVDKNTGEIHKK
jgi:anaerobic magnesium-protoporphyrin IX monomethyl ester cyclase